MHLPWLTADQLARLWRVPVGTVWRWASEDRWPRTRSRPTRYDPEAAQAGHDRREGARAETLANLEVHRRRVEQDR